MSATQTIYEGVNDVVLSLVPPSATRILDVGCGAGSFGECLRKQRERYVVGITYSEREAEMASPRLSKVHCADLNQFDFNPLGRFDCIVLSHVLEHLFFPDQILERLKHALEPEGVIIVALPNVVWWKQRLQFLIGRWKYQDWGILDRTHLRFFDRQSSAALLEDAGYEIMRRTTHGPFPLLKPVRKYMGPWAGKIDRWMSAALPGLLAMQFVYLARLKQPTVPPPP
ncbi:MAG TPA: class I SAM-dependent methyltransferase [Terriglobales bacterium]|nr:class I SAM-dependent methyltransferase [Terriglobales bacterium]